MKPLLLIAALLAINSYAQTFPMLSTTTNRTVTGGVTNLALLNGTNVFTGTNRFEAAKFFTVNQIGLRNLYSQTTNLYIATSAVSATPLTNNGDFSLTSSLLEYEMPPLLGSNSMLGMYFTIVKTTAQAAAIQYCVYVGTNTNAIYYQAAQVPASAGPSQSANPTLVFANLHSFNSQLAGISSSWAGGGSFDEARIMWPSNYVDTSVPWKLYIGIWSTTAATNIGVPRLRVDELVGQ